MSDRIHVATRKGLFTFERGSGWKLIRTSFLGDPVSMVLPDDRDGTVYAALNLGHFGVKLHRSENGGANWREIAVPAYPAQEGDDKAPALKLIWSLETAGRDRPGHLWAGTLPGGLFRSEDRGDSWTLDENLWERPERKQWFGGGYDEPGIHSICVDPQDSDHVTFGVSCGGVWRTRDGGREWTCESKGMFAVFMPPERREDPIIQDPHRLVQCQAQPEALWVQHHNGVFKSSDGGANWTSIDKAAPSVFGFACVVHPEDSQTAWFVPAVKDECRVPVDGRMVVSRTRDGGETFEVLRKGLPQEHAYDLVYRHGLDLDASGTRLAMGSTTGGLWVSEDAGDAWECLSTHLPPIYAVRFG
jgi:photosystem II stability/assembly factor-like uncharacterized protein